METSNATQTTVESIINAPLSKVWNYWISPEHITKWNQSSEDWHCPASENDVRVGGKFKHSMAAKDGSFSFDFEGEYNKVIENQSIESKLEDGRTIKVLFEDLGGQTLVKEVFDPEATNSIDMQKAGWEAILDSFKKYSEGN